MQFPCPASHDRAMKDRRVRCLCRMRALILELRLRTSVPNIWDIEDELFRRGVMLDRIPSLEYIR